ncbi:MAG: hypothetical protein ACXVA3_19125, partial [Vulcanimicrobiaceae bacterium]
LGPKDQIVLGYMTSCWRETITGGIVVVGQEQSLVQDSTIERVRADCDSSGMQLSKPQASQSAAHVLRSPSPPKQAAFQPKITLYGQSPVVEVKSGGTLVIERTDRQGERREIALTAKSLLRGKFYDFAKAGTPLTPGATYVATLGTAKVAFRIDPQAKPGATPIVGRLLRVE